MNTDKSARTPNADIFVMLVDLRKRARERSGVDVCERINGQRVTATHYRHNNMCVMELGGRTGLRDSAIVAALAGVSRG
jgi:hypothetical protein